MVKKLQVYCEAVNQQIKAYRFATLSTSAIFSTTKWFICLAGVKTAPLGTPVLQAVFCSTLE